QCPHPLIGLVAHWLEATAPKVRELALEIHMRRMYDAQCIEPIRFFHSPNAVFATASIVHERQPTTVVLACGNNAEVETLLQDAARHIENEPTQRALLELLVTTPTPDHSIDEMARQVATLTHHHALPFAL